MKTIQTADNVTIIPAKECDARDFYAKSDSIVRVAAYCRVSTNEEEQQNSYVTQVSYYTDYINANPDWRLVRIFADEGLSGTQTANRREFNRMMEYCRQHRIDLILCKSISRFARNTVDCLEYIRELKKLGVNVKFEKENIETLQINSEFTLSLYASFAQAESESISKNVTWGIEKAFQEGKVRYKLDQTLGYRMGAEGKPVIVEDEAAIVRLIFKLFLEGYTMKGIAEHLMDIGAKRRNGSPDWNRHHVNNILRNEKYAGDAILQKTYTVDCLTHQRAKNNGQKPKYVVSDCHDAIVDRSTWERVTLELAKRSFDARGGIIGNGIKRCRKKGDFYVEHCFDQMLKCPYCGGTYKISFWKKGDRKVVVWRCGIRMDYGTKKCDKSPSLHEDKLQRAIVKAVNAMIANAETVQETANTRLKAIQAELAVAESEYTDLNERIEEIRTRRDDILEVISGSSFDRFRDELKKLNAVEAEYKRRTDDLVTYREKLLYESRKTTAAQDAFSQMQPMSCFDDLTVRKLVDHMEVISKTKVKIFFHGGLECVADVEK